MMQRSYILNGLNREALNAQLAAALGAVYGGFADRETRDGFVVTVNLTDAATQADIDQLNALMANYDPQQLTPEQAARRQLEQKLAAARRDYQGVELDPADFAGESALIQSLARKIAWLEQEVADLRKL
ncbi:MAG TPA: hypothetical protein VKY59_12900 [Spirillospora sp.]|nr:hypothetical protein [Spirillospora sp.]